MPGAVLGNEGFAFGAKPGVMRLCLSRKNTWADIREQTTLASLFSLGSYAIVVLLKSPEKGACKTSGSPAFLAKAGLGCRQRRGLSCPFPARESEAVSKEPTPHNFCLEGVGVEDFHARDRQHGNTHQLCLLFPVPGHMLFFQG